MAREDQKLRSEAVRQAILDAALQIGLAEGFEAVSIRKIISRMNYSTGVVYHHFKDKQEVIDAVEASETAWLNAEIRKEIDELQPIAVNMRAVFHRVMRLAMEEPERYNLIVLHKYSRPRPSATPWVGFLSDAIHRDIERGRLRHMDAERAAFCVWSSFLGFNLMISRRAGLAADEANALFDTQADIILKGILSHG